MSHALNDESGCNSGKAAKNPVLLIIIYGAPVDVSFAKDDAKIVSILWAAGVAEGAIDAANILKPALATGELQCIGATTLDEYRKHIGKDPALERRFQPVCCCTIIIPVHKVVICQNEAEKCFIETSINSLHISLKFSEYFGSLSMQDTGKRFFACKTVSVYHVGPNGWTKLSGDDFGRLHHSYYLVEPAVVEQEMTEVVTV
ncbi:hypothetical protein CTI12_AA255170 [Artemisia annua]|uniref:Uncharacterized protein n=1 Tax=Artemisia annua TaxID=35608 RepID=A0A2U1NKY9_ARTAN|nr:hypothetical protein CTI12_AA255170 [Artemisia annua]